MMMEFWSGDANPNLACQINLVFLIVLLPLLNGNWLFGLNIHDLMQWLKYMVKYMA